MYPQCTRRARMGANRASRKCRPKCFVLRRLWCLGGVARTEKNGGERSVGAQGRNRTTDTVIFSHVLYQLSYLGAAPTGGGGSPRYKGRPGVQQAER